jgi:nucleotide-binding universal stress UspA family protein
MTGTMSPIFHRILCPIDFDDNSIAALDLACKLATQNDARVYLMHADAFPIGATEITVPADPVPAWEEGSLAKLNEIAAARIPQGLSHEVVTRSGAPAEQIVRAVLELNIDLIVMATHGRQHSAIRHLLMGSVAESVVRESSCPVMVLPPRP